MNVERLHAIALAVKDDLTRTELSNQLSNLANMITNQVNAPQEPSYQTAVAAALDQLRQALGESAIESCPPTWQQTLSELGLTDLLGNQLGDRLNGIFARNQITLAVARDEVQAIATDLSSAVVALDQLLAGFQYFQIGSEELAPGEIEVSVLIPRPAVYDQLPDLGQEFIKLQSLLAVFLELGTGSRPPLKVRAIASTDFAVYVGMAPAAAAALAKTLDWVLEAYKKLLEIRKLRQGLADQGVSEKDLGGVDDHANAHMSRSIETVAEEMITAAAITDQARANELRIELRHSLNSLANRIDHGYNIDVRAGALPPAGGGSAEEAGSQDAQPDRAAVDQIIQTAPRLRFVNRSGRPILSLDESRPIQET